MTLNQSKLAKYLKKQAAANGLSHRSAADKIGISAATYNRLVNEVGLPDVNTYYLCCKWMEYDMEYFFTK